MKHLLVTAMALGACVESEDYIWDDGTRVAVVIQTQAPEASGLAFKERMRRDMGLWNSALVARGCKAPFVYVDSIEDADRTIYLRNKSAWTFPGAVGLFFGGEIHILSEGDGTLDTYVTDPWWIVGLHELGHSLGLDHANRTDSVMQEGGQPDVEPLSESDIGSAAASIGCD